MILLNIVLFQAAWFVCVLGAANDRPVIGVAVVLAVVALHLLRADRPRAEARLMAITALIGTVWDSALVSYAGFNYGAGNWPLTPAPYWIIAMWPLFATTINVSLRWLKHRTFAGALFGAAGGPLAFYAGHRLGAVEFDSLVSAMCILALGWAVLVPALMALSRRFDGMDVRFGPDAPARVVAE